MRTSTLLCCTLFLLFTALFNRSSAQEPSWAWAKGIGSPGIEENDYCNDVAVDADGYVYVTGSFRDDVEFGPDTAGDDVELGAAGLSDAFVLKLHPSGVIIWARRIGGSGVDAGYSIAVDASGNVYTAGNFTGTTDFDPGPGAFNLTASAGTMDVFILKLDGNGDLVWARSTGSPSGETVTSVAVSASGNVHIGGRFTGTNDFDPGPATFDLTSAGDYDLYFLKLNALGEFVWARSIGGLYIDQLEDLALDATGNLYGTGTFRGVVDFDPGAGVLELTPPGPTNDEIFINKLNSGGDLVWAHRVGTSSDFDEGTAIAIDASSNVVVAGQFGPNTDLDPGPGIATFTTAGGVNPDAFILKLTSAGDYIWAKTFGGHSSDWIRAVTLDPSGSIYATGTYQGDADFDPGPDEFMLEPFAGFDAFISKLDVSGDFAWAKSMGSTDSESGNSVAADQLGNAMVVGYFMSPVIPFDTITVVNADPVPPTADGFIARLGDMGTAGVHPDRLAAPAMVFPNPTTGPFTVVHPAAGIFTLEIRDAMGREIRRATTTGTRTEINLSDHPTGVYFVIIRKPERSLPIRVIKQ